MSTYVRRPAAGPADDRRRGCVGFLLLPFVLAARIHRPARPDRIVDGAIERAQITRTAVGVIATCWLIYAYPLRESAGSVLSDKLTEVLLSAGLLLILGPIALAAFVLGARRPGPAFYRPRLRGPLTALGALFGTALLMWLIPNLDSIGGLGFVLTFVGGLGYLFLVPFAVASAVLCVHHTFRTADVHEVLPPLISPVLVWAMCVFQLFDSPPVTAPLGVRILFLMGPPLSVTALSFWELRRLRACYGITVRRALGRG
ncbi:MULTISPECIES: hypothetical protein [unclassified Streptomyces]|uniref:hypothetical protein n=1 Tax=unclassified Streptomyces TaxID=2593676 RepID=UPI001BEAFD79|nr:MULTISPECIES: hypothetical protein [unclassified Streptomyces]MBT2405447.1 hypothetical protein [Streptomyces sp. ISL-21]MBT2456008.1 hypothetical protein [Streptomyces sp. ISL-86]MBT2608066.1 hypothetical protein [Streptomyces sp. ISL-87]